MSLIMCPECKRMISNTAKSCPKCGFEINEESLKQYEIDHPKMKDIINCPKCARMISKNSITCKHCGLDMSPEGIKQYAIDHPKLLASVNCPFCNKRISKESKICKYCHSEIKPEEMLKQQKKATKQTTIGCLSILGILIVVGIIGALVEPDKSSTPKPPVETVKTAKQSSAVEDADAFKRQVINRDPKGSVWQVEVWLEDNVNDPKSLEYLEWGQVQETKQGNYSVVLKYRAKNAMGALIIKKSVFFLNKEGDVIRYEDLE